jgi:hypothetical protein
LSVVAEVVVVLPVVAEVLGPRLTEVTGGGDWVEALLAHQASKEAGCWQALLQRLLVAAVVNAAYESSLDAAIEGDSGKAVGLFQLREDGAGIGMSKRERKDAFLNTARIGQRFGELRKFFVSLAETEAKVPGSTPLSAWTGLFARYVEAPTDKDGAQKVRGDTAATAFLPVPIVERGKPEVLAPASEPSILPWILGGILVTTVAIGLGTSVVNRSRR